ncbi:MAG TPA: acyl-CoA desaturase [Pirellulales bacterium]
MTPVEILKQKKKLQKAKRDRNRLRKGQPVRSSVARDAASAEARANRWSRGYDWPVIVWITLLHVGAIGALFCFTWKGLALGFALAWITGVIGITLGYHRYLTHGSFTTYPWVRRTLAFIGGLAGEGSALMWVAVHRKHHEFSDHEGDPHSPREGFWWSHMIWLVPNRGGEYQKQLFQRYAPDLYKDPVMRFLDKTFIVWHILLGVTLFAVGYYGWDLYTACSFVAYGMFLRLVYVLHITWFVNSATHMWGYRNYETTDDSRNLWWVGLLAYGEGWHNNHHAFQRMARHGHRWWEFDMTYGVIVAMEKLGLAWNLVRDVPERQKALAARSS